MLHQIKRAFSPTSISPMWRRQRGPRPCALPSARRGCRNIPRHIPSAEVHHLGAQASMYGVQCVFRSCAVVEDVTQGSQHRNAKIKLTCGFEACQENGRTGWKQRRAGKRPALVASGGNAEVNRMRKLSSRKHVGNGVRDDPASSIHLVHDRAFESHMSAVHDNANLRNGSH